MGCYGAVGTGSAGSATTINNGNITLFQAIFGRYLLYFLRVPMMLAELQALIDCC
jgi:hypothetical protein